MIREATPADLGRIIALVRELARYEKEPDAVVATEDDFRAALFGPDPKVFALVAEHDHQVVGIAVWFLAFSTWTGRHTLYLEDLFVDPAQRGRGFGRDLLTALAGRAAELGCARMEWSVLDWNEPAIGFYRSLGAEPMDDWTTFRLSGPALTALGSPSPGA